HVVPRAIGAAKVAGGVAGVAAGAALCKGTFGLGCYAGAALATASADVAYSGTKELIYGRPAPTLVGQIGGPVAQNVEEAVVGAAGVASAFKSLLARRVARTAAETSAEAAEGGL